MKFRKKPVVVEVIKWDGSQEGFLGVLDWANKLAGAHLSFVFWETNLNKDPKIKIRTLEGDMFASEGDWIIRGVKGEFYPCKPDIFEQTYEKV